MNEIDMYGVDWALVKKHMELDKHLKESKPCAVCHETESCPYEYCPHEDGSSLFRED